MFKSRSRYPLLRNDILYPHMIPVCSTVWFLLLILTFVRKAYYLALICNVAIRFAWVFYLPVAGPSFALRTWIVAVSEVFRRWLWNFCKYFLLVLQMIAC